MEGETMSYIATAIKLVAETETNDTQTRLDYLKEKTEDDNSFLGLLVKNAPRILEQEKADTIQKPYRFYIEPNLTIH